VRAGCVHRRAEVVAHQLSHTPQVDSIFNVPAGKDSLFSRPSRNQRAAASGAPCRGYRAGRGLLAELITAPTPAVTLDRGYMLPLCGRNGDLVARYARREDLVSGHVLDLVPASQPRQRPDKYRAPWPSGIRGEHGCVRPCWRAGERSGRSRCDLFAACIPPKVIRAARPPCGEGIAADRGPASCPVAARLNQPGMAAVSLCVTARLRTVTLGDETPFVGRVVP
jgi:hypothetical protein